MKYLRFSQNSTIRNMRNIQQKISQIVKEILQLEKLIIDQEVQKMKKKHIRFVKPNHQKQQLVIPQKEAYLSPYDNFEDTIQKNKAQLKRQNKYTDLIDMKLKAGPSKKVNEIKPPLMYGQQQLAEHVIQRLKAIDDLQYEEELQKREKFIKAQKERNRCKFVSKSLMNSPNLSPRRNKTGFIKNPENSVKLEEQVEQSKALSCSKNTESKEKKKYMNTASLAITNSHRMIKQSSQKILKNQSKTGVSKSISHSKGTSSPEIDKDQKQSVMKRGNNSYQSLRSFDQPKRNLIAQTKKIRKQVQEMKTFSRYDEMLYSKRIKEVINQK